MKCKVGKLDIVKLEKTPFDSSKLSNVVKMMLLKRLNITNFLKKLILSILLILMI